MRARYLAARRRETDLLMAFKIAAVDRTLVVLLVAFVALDILDIGTTMFAISIGPPFVELNPVAAVLFELEFPGIAAAVGLKLVPLALFSYLTFMKEDWGRPVYFRAFKVGGMVALAAAVILYIFLIGSNVSHLVGYFHPFG